jgi:hypothetical protein
MVVRLRPRQAPHRRSLLLMCKNSMKRQKVRHEEKKELRERSRPRLRA